MAGQVKQESGQANPGSRFSLPLSFIRQGVIWIRIYTGVKEIVNCKKMRNRRDRINQPLQ